MAAHHLDDLIEGLDIANSSASLASSIQNYRIENGRRFHAYKDGVYLMPNDEPELDRLDLHHHVISLILGGRLFLAPLKKPKRVLDIGTGTGIWAIEFADENPDSSVLGTDLSPIQPEWLPPNLRFQIDDAEDPWMYHEAFDFIHIRSMSGSIADWKHLFEQAYQHLAPGGWIEIQEHQAWLYADDDSVERAPMSRRWQEELRDASFKIGRPFLQEEYLGGYLEEIGFEHVTVDIKKCAHGPWPEDRNEAIIGLYQQAQILEATKSYGAAHFTRVLGWTAQEFTVLAAKVRNEIRDPSLHMYSRLYDIYARKPY